MNVLIGYFHFPFPHQLRRTGRMLGPLLQLEARLLQQGSQKEPIESILMEDSEQLLVESCHGNCLGL